VNRVATNAGPLLADTLELEGVRSVGAVKTMLVYGRQRLRRSAALQGLRSSSLFTEARANRMGTVGTEWLEGRSQNIEYRNQKSESQSLNHGR